MPKMLPTLLPADLERHLLTKGVGHSVAGRDACADCGRTPLVGEDVHRYDEDAGVCELCRPLRREAPRRTERVRHSGRGLAVRLRRAAA